MFNIQSKNVQYLRKIINILKKDINDAIKRSDDFEIAMKTKILTLTYSAWSEAQLTQILYTPNSFSTNEITSILNAKKYNVRDGWEKLIDISLSKTRHLDIRIIKTDLMNFVDKYIIKQSKVRNKLAHGQWINALESNLTTVDVPLTNELKDLNVVSIMIEFEVHTILGKIIRDLVQSPNNSFTCKYTQYKTELDNYLIKTQNWNINDKTNKVLATKRVN